MKIMKKVLLITILVILLLAISGCQEMEPVYDAVDSNHMGAQLIRQIDNEAGVVCYRFNGVDGIDCLPVSETRLSGHE